MFEKFTVWFGKYRKPAGYTIGTVNLLGGIQYLNQGDTTNGWLFIMLGYILILDTWDSK